jgi:hypothetical protein
MAQLTAYAKTVNPDFVLAGHAQIPGTGSCVDAGYRTWASQDRTDYRYTSYVMNHDDIMKFRATSKPEASYKAPSLVAQDSAKAPSTLKVIAGKTKAVTGTLVKKVTGTATAPSDKSTTTTTPVKTSAPAPKTSDSTDAGSSNKNSA